MPIGSSDTLVLTYNGPGDKPVTTMAISGQSAAYSGEAHHYLISSAYNSQVKFPSVSLAVFDALDTTLDWMRIARKLEEFRALPKGWDGYNASPPDVQPLNCATTFLNVLRHNRCVPSRVAPSVVGGVGVTFRTERRKVYVEFSNKGTVHVLFSDGVSEPVVQKVAPDLLGYRTLFTKMRAYLDE